MKPATPEQLAAFVATPPPRPIPPVIADQVRSVKLLRWFGLFFLAIGLVFTWIFLPRRPLEAWRLDRGAARTAGKVLASTETRYNEGGSRSSRGTPVYAHRFRFTDVAGREFEGISYETGRQRRAGAEVTVEYLTDDPTVARIRGTRLNVLGLLPALVLLFPLVGLLVILVPGLRRRNQLRLLRDGRFTFAEVVAVKATRVTVNDQQRCLLTTRFEADGLPVQITRPVYGADAELALRRAGQGERIGLLYDPRRPQRALLTGRLLDRQPI